MRSQERGFLPRLANRRSLLSGLILAVVLLGGAFLRLNGLGFGLPFVYHPDEHYIPFYAFESGHNRFNPGWFGYPSLFMYVVLSVYIVYFMVLNLTGRSVSTSDLYRLFREDPTVFYLLGRGVVALLGTATILLVYEIGRRAYGRLAGVLASLFMAVCLLHVRESHFLTVDVPTTFLIVGALLLSVEALGGKRKWLWYSAALSGLAGACKYPGMLVVACPLTVAWLLRRGRASNGSRPCTRTFPTAFLSGLLLVCGAAFIAGCPYCLLDLKVFWNDLGYQSWATWRTEMLFGSHPEGGLYYLKGALIGGMGIPLAISCLLGLGYGLWRRRPEDIVICTFLVTYGAYLVFAHRQWGRWFVPLVPCFCLLSGRLCQTLWRLLFHRAGLRRRLIGAAFVPLLIYVPARDSIRMGLLLKRKDTRTQAWEWLTATCQEGDRILVTAFGPQFPNLEKRQPATVHLENSLLLDREIWENASEPPKAPRFAFIASEGIDYVVLNSFYEGPLEDAGKRSGPFDLLAYKACFREVRSKCSLLRTFGKPMPWNVEDIYGPLTRLSLRNRPGPYIEVYKCDGSPSDEGR